MSELSRHVSSLLKGLFRRLKTMDHENFKESKFKITFQLTNE